MPIVQDLQSIERYSACHAWWVRLRYANNRWQIFSEISGSICEPSTKQILKFGMESQDDNEMQQFDYNMANTVTLLYND
jgi:hypothetical protein